MLQAIGCGMRDDDTEGERRDWRLELDATVHRDQDIVLAAHPAQKLAILVSNLKRSRRRARIAPSLFNPARVGTDARLPGATYKDKPDAERTHGEDRRPR